MLKKKKWKKPTLIVLAREKPGEAVLTACKGVETGAPNYKDSECVDLVVYGPGDWECTGACASITSS